MEPRLKFELYQEVLSTSDTELQVIHRLLRICRKRLATFRDDLVTRLEKIHQGMDEDGVWYAPGPHKVLDPTDKSPESEPKRYLDTTPRVLLFEEHIVIDRYTPVNRSIPIVYVPWPDKDRLLSLIECLDWDMISSTWAIRPSE